MTKLHVCSAFFAALLLAGCQQPGSALDMPPGKYEKSVSTTDSQGTTTTREVSTDVDQYNDGKTAVVKTKTTTDPKGLFNKTTSKSKVVEEEHY